MIVVKGSFFFSLTPLLPVVENGTSIREEEMKDDENDGCCSSLLKVDERKDEGERAKGWGTARIVEKREAGGEKVVGVIFLF